VHLLVQTINNNNAGYVRNNLKKKEFFVALDGSNGYANAHERYITREMPLSSSVTAFLF